MGVVFFFFFFSSRRRHTRLVSDWSSDVALPICAQKWVLDKQQKLIDTIVSETGKTHEDALLAEIAYVGSAFGFWAKNAPEYLADEKIRSANPFVLGRKLV